MANAVRVQEVSVDLLEACLAVSRFAPASIRDNERRTARRETIIAQAQAIQATDYLADLPVENAYGIEQVFSQLPVPGVVGHGQMSSRAAEVLGACLAGLVDDDAPIDAFVLRLEGDSTAACVIRTGVDWQYSRAACGTVDLTRAIDVTNDTCQLAFRRRGSATDRSR